MFFSNLILFTAGLAVLLLWVVILSAGLIELWDYVFEKDKPEEEK